MRAGDSIFDTITYEGSNKNNTSSDLVSPQFLTPPLNYLCDVQACVTVTVCENGIESAYECEYECVLVIVCIYVSECSVVCKVCLCRPININCWKGTVSRFAAVTVHVLFLLYVRL